MIILTSPADLPRSDPTVRQIRLDPLDPDLTDPPEGMDDTVGLAAFAALGGSR